MPKSRSALSGRPVSPDFGFDFFGGHGRDACGFDAPRYREELVIRLVPQRRGDQLLKRLWLQQSSRLRLIGDAVGQIQSHFQCSHAHSTH